jgi:hypothetical protein
VEWTHILPCLSRSAPCTAQQGLVGVELTRLQNLVGLYKALGGGWEKLDTRAARGPDNWG